MSDKNKNKNQNVETANTENNETTQESPVVENSHLADRIAGKVDEQGNKIEEEKA